MNKQELVQRIKETAYTEGDFLLRSGKRSKYYIDKYLFETSPDILYALGEEFAKHTTSATTLIAGAELGGVALAASTALLTRKNWIIVRNSMKDYGTKRMIEGVIRPGDSVLLVEDIATTGGQVLEAAALIKEAGGKIEQIVAVIDRQQGAKENIEKSGYKFNSIMTKQDLGIKD